MIERDLRRLVDAEPEQEQRRERGGRDVAQEADRRLPERLDRSEAPDRESDHDADGHADRVALEDAHRARLEVGAQARRCSSSSTPAFQAADGLGTRTVLVDQNVGREPPQGRAGPTTPANASTTRAESGISPRSRNSAPWRRPRPFPGLPPRHRARARVRASAVGRASVGSESAATSVASDVRVATLRSRNRIRVGLRELGSEEALERSLLLRQAGLDEERVDLAWRCTGATSTCRRAGTPRAPRRR